MSRLISAADIEKYGYCPLSWWLSWNKQPAEGNAALREGTEKHGDIAESVYKVRRLEIQALTTEKVVLWYAIIATIIAIFGLDLLPWENSQSVSNILLVVSLVWILVALAFLRIAFKTPIKSTIIQYEKIILVFAIISVLIALNAVAFLGVNPELALISEICALVFLIGASFFLQRSLTYSLTARRLKEELKIEGSVEYIDMGESELLVSEKYGLSGRPDYVMLVEGKKIPVEEKTGRRPRGPLFSHIIQVAAYCLLLEEKSGTQIPYGILKYGADQHIIEFDESLRKTLIEKIIEMRQIADGEATAHRNHNKPTKCEGCSRRNICPEKLQ